MSGARLVRDYLSGEEDVAGFFSGTPFSLDSFRRKWSEVQGRFGRAERERAARALRPSSERARAKLARFVEEGGAVVTTGQQAGLFTGPLFTIYKALTVARLAEALERELGIPVLPVFWTASEDHDWAEVNHTFMLAERQRGVRRVELPSDDDRVLPMSDRLLGEGVRNVLDELEQAVADQPFADDVLKLVRGAYLPGETVAGAFSSTMQELLSACDLLFTDAADPHLKEASLPVLERALLDAPVHEEVLVRRSRELERAGYHAQVAVLENATNVFYHGSGERERLYRDKNGFRLHDSGQVKDADALLAELHGSSGLFSPNVFLRPIVESAVFPTLSYVAGPGELSYFAQITALFPEFGIEPPVISPRASFTLVETAVEHLLEKLNLSIAELSEPVHELQTRIARDAMPEAVRSRLQELDRALVHGYRELIEESRGLDPALGGALGALRNESLAHLRTAERKVVQQLKKRETIALSQLERARAAVRPEGQPQERVLNILPFLARYGFGLLQDIQARIPVTFADVPAACGCPAEASS